VAPRSLEDARRLVRRVPDGADAIEYRLDLAEEVIPPGALLELDARPAILTHRSVSEGGRFSGGDEEYRRLVAAAYDAGAVVDVEHARGLLADSAALPDRGRVIVSHHAPFSLPGDWQERLSAMRATRAHAVKLVAGAGDLAQSLRIAGLQRTQDGAAAIFPMGPASPPGRVLSALYGAALVYGPVERETAPGQISLDDLLSVYEVQRSRKVEALFGILGASPSRSLSPRLYNTLFRTRGLPYVYLPLPISDFEREAPTSLQNDPPFRGFAVTQPWKLPAARAGRASEDVEAVGAANTLFLERRRWRAENTDVDGVFDPLADYDTGEGRSAIVLGAGGAARAAIVAARRLGYEVAVAARRDGEADRVAEKLGVDSMAWADVSRSEADLYVNATPVGWRDEEPSAVPPRLFEGRPLVFDCVYRRDGRETSTIREARAAGCPTIDGLRMLAAQAVRQAVLFGVESVSFEEVRAVLSAATEP
ncbi:MAG: type I 3-dehydroquinate dehydratase, partial [Thermoanaerobaculia bacterium]